MRPLQMLLHKFGSDQNGAFAILFATMSIVLVALGGSTVDYAFWMAARNAAQEAVDAGALAAAASSAEDSFNVTAIASGVVDAHLERWPGVGLISASYNPANKRVLAHVGGNVPTHFIGLVGIHTLPVDTTSTAERATNGQLELALVLDNTYSMSDSDGSGSTKIASLKSAAHILLDALWEENNPHIRVGMVPYAEYVNVGTGNRSQPWMSVPADTQTTTPGSCTTQTGYNKCTKPGVKGGCTSTSDGVTRTVDCPCQETTWVAYDPPRQSCSADRTTTTTWYGCVLSRVPRNLRLSDAEPYTNYQALMGTSRRCMTEITPLTNAVGTLRSAVDAMQTHVGSYYPSTHIPSGLVWGINLVSPSQPFSEGRPYDANNQAPRKAIVLMTDGDNTLRFNTGNGQHNGFSGTATQIAAQKTATDNDTTALCNYAKSQQIEVFTVSFGVLTEASNTMLRGCASSENHYFPATNAADLTRAFENIADQLRVVRIVN